MNDNLSRYALLLGRILLSVIFIGSGLNKIGDWSGTASFMASYGMTAIPLFLIGAIVFEVLGGFAILTGYQARLGAVALFIMLIPTTMIFHGFWAVEEAAYRLPVTRMRPLMSLALLVAVGIVLGYIVGTHADAPISREEASTSNPIAATEASVERGRTLFMRDCMQCHGETGRGDGPLASSLSIPPANLYDHIPFHPDQFFFGVITKGLSGVMPAFEDSISEEDRWNILNFLRDQFGDSEPATQ